MLTTKPNGIHSYLGMLHPVNTLVVVPTDTWYVGILFLSLLGSSWLTLPYSYNQLEPRFLGFWRIWLTLRRTFGTVGLIWR
jgi:hypothetical protein